MLSKKLYVIILLISSIIIGMFMVYKSRFPGWAADTEDVPKVHIPESGHVGIIDKPNDETQYNMKVAESGPITVLPWENDEKFIKARQENGTPLLMAAYRTVLRDPLPGEEYNVHLGASRLAGMVIKPGEQFSHNRSLGPYTISKGYQRGPTYIGSQLTTTIGGGVCKLASTLYNVAILSNLEIVERHFHSMPVPYVPYGQDATVSYGAKDFIFRNNTGHSIMIWAKGIDNILYIGFYGVEKPPRIEWKHETLSTVKAPRMYRTNSSLPDGIEKVVLEGMDGASVKSWLVIHNPDGSTTTKNLGISYYKPMPFLMEKSR